MIKYILLFSRQGKLRLAKWFNTTNPKTKAHIIKDLTQQVLARRPRMCNVLESVDTRVIYRRYASLFFVCGIDAADNELMTLEILHRYVEVLDNIFNFQKAYAVLDELVMAGEFQESSKSSALRSVNESDLWEENEHISTELAKAFF
ncbi:AP complex, mu/sigma subunit [Mycena metata]|uniref:AP complex subunit sigma n=1 Tax=Mycena metata TaxID=1033252 RepID=A0AAD7KHV5_9AGAR|nr:AP complex, mu/sigma subunit [Mycena metata]